MKYLSGRFGHCCKVVLQSCESFCNEESLMKASLTHLRRIFWCVIVRLEMNEGQFCKIGSIEIYSKLSSSSDFCTKFGLIEATN